MKKTYLLLMLVFLFIGCRSTKKITESTSKASSQTSFVQNNDIKEAVKTENDKQTYKKTTITETEYDTPEEPDQNVAPSTSTNPDVPDSPPKKPRVKSTKTTVIEEGTVDKSKVETNKEDNSKIKGNTESKSQDEIKVTDTKTNPIRWGWIFGILAIVVVVLIYFRNSPVLLPVRNLFNKLFNKQPK